MGKVKYRIGDRFKTYDNDYDEWEIFLYGIHNGEPYYETSLVGTSKETLIRRKVYEREIRVITHLEPNQWASCTCGAKKLGDPGHMHWCDIMRREPPREERDDDDDMDLMNLFNGIID